MGEDTPECVSHVPHWPREIPVLFFNLIFILYWSIVDLQYCVRFQVYSTVIHLYVYIYPLFFRFFSIVGYYGILSRVPCVYSRSLLIIYFIYSSVSMSNLISQFIPPSPCPSVSTCLFSTSTSLFLPFK